MRAATRNIIRKTWYGCWISGAFLLIVLALVFSAIRVMLPLATDYKSDIESLAARTLGHPVQIARIDTDWLWFRPRLRLIGVRVDDTAGGSALFAAQEVILAMNPFSSIMNRKVEIDELTVVRTDFSVSRDEAGHLYARGFALPVQMDPAAGTEPAVPDFLRGRTLRVVDSVVGFSDAASGINYRLQAVNLALRLGRDHHRLYLSVSLPGEIGKRFEVGAELRGDLRDLQGLKGQLYVRVAGLELPAVLRKTSYRRSVKSGRLDFALWADLDPEAGREIQGNINLQDFAGNFTGVPLLAGFKSPFNRISADLRGRLAGDGLDLELENLLLSKGETAAPLNGLAIKTSIGAQAFERGEIMIDHLRLQQVWPIAMHYKVLRKALAKAGIKAVNGDLLGFYGKWEPAQGGGARKITLSSRFEELGVTGSGKTPSISNLRGTARLLNNNAVIDFETVGSQLDYPFLFRNKITLQSLDGPLYAHFAGSSLTLAVRNLLLQTPHVSSRHWLDLQFATGKAPYANIYSTYKDGDVSSGPQYLPVTIMSKELVSWLDRAVVSGRLVDGDLELRGPLDKFPFRHNEGIFRTDTDFDGMEIDYFEDWPHLQNARLHTRFYGATMAIAVHEGRVSDTDISGADAWITDFNQSWLIVQAPVAGPLSGTVSYLRNSGLREHLEPLIDQVTASGAQSGLVYLDIPLHDGPEVKWRYTSSIFDGAFTFTDLGLEFKNINCSIRLDQESMHAAPFAATLNNHPVKIDIGTYAEETGNTAHISIAGETAPAKLLRRKGFDAAEYIKGTAKMDAAIELPLTKTQATERYPSIDLRLDTRATAISLPEPFAKDAGVPSVLSMHSQFRDRFVLVDVAYGGWFEGKLRLEGGSLERAGIRLFEGSPGLPEEPGLFITGRVGSLNIDRWLALHGTGATAVNPLQRIELRVGQLTYLGRTLPDAVLQLTQQPQYWFATVESQFLTGSVAIPKPDPSAQKLDLDLKYADVDYFMAQSRASDKPLLPGDIPPFKLKSERIILNGWNLLQTELDTVVDKQVLSGNFRVSDPDVGLEGKVEWSADKKGAQRTEISLAFDSKNVGRGLGKFGYAEIIREGAGTAKFDLAWPAPPQGFDLSIMSGEGQMSLKDGRVLDIKPGGGRLFGLLSVQTIPRRLAFDFSDVFAEGFSFDKMKGNFDFSGGEAYTDNYVIDGPVGRIDIKGRVGMVQRDYDQNILFRPDLSSSLPIVGTLLGGTGTGLALIMIDRLARLFGKQTDDLARFEYTLTGSWDDPVMTPVKPKPLRKDKDKDK
ncbi:MAG TPA: YhdP family protein [Gammaproteobacteria bacterium]|nr:YhdP family protein [Gammaproteobacteria bacterium]